MRDWLRHLYDGDGAGPRAFRIAVFVFDVATVVYFLYTATAAVNARLLALDVGIGLIVGLDLAARFWITEERKRFFMSVTNIADIVVLLSLALPLIANTNLAFLRVLRVLRLVRSLRVAHHLDTLLAKMPINTRVSVAAANLFVFIFVVTSLVWVLENQTNDDLNTFVDALYFTITTLTTTGYGDITLDDKWGRILTIIIMVFGIGFFLKLLQALYRPDKVENECPTCGLTLHDRDAIHCKHCGTTIHIETEGET
ncbi:voltage-gated potassium channel [Palleronia marisminoris]|uniref:pH-gated potassium channel KcsA n=1 Tax=Palleronia marisminoris TaxID=315423 RepID=A0A1Y5RHC5_9RHOB|nr:ion channel [Palleronia marisminoris]SFG21084.1 voltage-gated potassium channel [Palleronia marisminoris]SLN17376.1 pH-gated potassium channel KcsA [Palleronia marisminoris]